MRHTSLVACLSLVLLATSARAGDAEAPVAPSQPMLLMASATACNDIITLHLRTTQLAPATVETVMKIPVRETVLANGTPVERTRLVEERRVTQVLRAASGSVIDVTVDGAAVGVYEINGKPALPARIKALLRKETAVLVSITGPVDPYFLQTTRPGTLIVQIPPQVLASPAGPELLIPPTIPVRPAAISPNEPPIAPAKP